MDYYSPPTMGWGSGLAVTRTCSLGRERDSQPRLWADGLASSYPSEFAQWWVLSSDPSPYPDTRGNVRHRRAWRSFRWIGTSVL